MEAEMVVVLVLTAFTVGFIVWLNIHTRRGRSNTQSAGAGSDSAVQAKTVEPLDSLVRTKGQRQARRL